MSNEAKSTPTDIESFHRLPTSLDKKLNLVDEIADELANLLDWDLSIDLQVAEIDGKDKLYSISVIVGKEEDAPILFSTATADEAVIRLQILLKVLKQLDIEKLSESQEHYQECLARLDKYFNDDCDDLVEQEVLLSFFDFNDNLQADKES